MKKRGEERGLPFFVVSTFNYSIADILFFAKDFFVYEQSDIKSIKNKNNRLVCDFQKITSYQNPGHNLSAYFDFIISNFDNLPDRLALLKANIIGRHVSRAYLEKNLQGSNITFLWDDEKFQDKPGVAFRLHSGRFAEHNGSWFVPGTTHSYFDSTDELLSYFFEDYYHLEFLVFAPGANYIVDRTSILRYPIDFWKSLKFLSDYSFRTGEAFMIERILGLIFEGSYEVSGRVTNFQNFLNAMTARGGKNRNQTNNLKCSERGVWRYMYKLSRFRQ